MVRDSAAVILRQLIEEMEQKAADRPLPPRRSQPRHATPVRCLQRVDATTTHEAPRSSRPAEYLRGLAARR